MMSGSEQGHSHNPLSEELRLLLNLLADYGEPWLDRVAGVPGKDSNTVPATCNWCPLCAIAALIRGDRSELAARTAERMAMLLGQLRIALTEVAARSSGESWDTSGGARPDEEPVARSRPRQGAAPTGRVQHIQVRRSGEPSEDSEL